VLGGWKGIKFYDLSRWSDKEGEDVAPEREKKGKNPPEVELART